jgi:hypothetical protein
MFWIGGTVGLFLPGRAGASKLDALLMSGSRMTTMKTGTRKARAEAKLSRALTTVAGLTRYDYAAAVSGSPTEVTIDAPLQVIVAMNSAYAVRLLEQLRDAVRALTIDSALIADGGCAQIALDCPVKIVMDFDTLRELIDTLTKES